MNEQRGAAPLTLQNAKKRRIPAAVSSATTIGNRDEYFKLAKLANRKAEKMQ